nr:hypothetical protein [Tanacetum cinerariifolium]
MLPIHNVRKNLDAAKTSGWKIESTKAFQKIKRRLAKLPTLVVPKEGEKQSLNTRFSCEPAIEGDRNLLHSKREGDPNISPYDKVPEDNFTKAQNQSGNRWPHGRNAKTLQYQGTIGKISSRIKKVSCLEHPKEGIRGAAGEKILQIGRPSATCVG